MRVRSGLALGSLTTTTCIPSFLPSGPLLFSPTPHSPHILAAHSLTRGSPSPHCLAPVVPCSPRPRTPIRCITAGVTDRNSHHDTFTKSSHVFCWRPDCVNLLFSELPPSSKITAPLSLSSRSPSPVERRTAPSFEPPESL